MSIDDYILHHGNFMCFKTVMEHIIRMNPYYDISKLIKFIENNEYQKDSWVWFDFIKNNLSNELIAYIKSLHF